MPGSSNEDHFAGFHSSCSPACRSGDIPPPDKLRHFGESVQTKELTIAMEVVERTRQVYHFAADASMRTRAKRMHSIDVSFSVGHRYLGEIFGL
jgi:hypothetical protein